MKITCKEMGMSDCDFATQDSEAKDAAKQMIDHVQQAHPDKAKEVKEKLKGFGGGLAEKINL